MRKSNTQRERERRLKTGSRICHYHCGIPKCLCLIAYCRFSFPSADSHMTGINKSPTNAQAKNPARCAVVARRVIPRLLPCRDFCTVSCPLSGLAGIEPALNAQSCILPSPILICTVYIYIYMAICQSGVGHCWGNKR